MKFKGVGVALVTPFDENGKIDEVALGGLVDDVIAGGVDYLVALGTTSEAATMSEAERMEVLRLILLIIINHLKRDYISILKLSEHVRRYLFSCIMYRDVPLPIWRHLRLSVCRTIVRILSESRRLAVISHKSVRY